MNQVLAVVLVVLLALAMAAPAFAHNECSSKGVARYDHAHGQSAVAVNLCLPLAAENGVHGDFH
jgi:hypothetical protein